MGTWENSQDSQVPKIPKIYYSPNIYLMGGRGATCLIYFKCAIVINGKDQWYNIAELSRRGDVQDIITVWTQEYTKLIGGNRKYE